MNQLLSTVRLFVCVTQIWTSKEQIYCQLKYHFLQWYTLKQITFSSPSSFFLSNTTGVFQSVQIKSCFLSVLLSYSCFQKQSSNSVSSLVPGCSCVSLSLKPPHPWHLQFKIRDVKLISAVLSTMVSGATEHMGPNVKAEGVGQIHSFCC